VMWRLRRASGPTVSRSMNSGSALRSIASSTLSTRKRRPTGCPIPVCAKPPIPPIGPSSGSICSTISVAKPPVCWEARQVARISPSCALSFPRPPFRRSPVMCGTRMTESRRTKRLQGTVRQKPQTNTQTTSRHSSWVAATRCDSTARRCDSFIRAGMATHRVQRSVRIQQANKHATPPETATAVARPV